MIILAVHRSSSPTATRCGLYLGGIALIIVCDNAGAKFYRTAKRRMKLRTPLAYKLSTLVLTCKQKRAQRRRNGLQDDCLYVQILDASCSSSLRTPDYDPVILMRDQDIFEWKGAQCRGFRITKILNGAFPLQEISIINLVTQLNHPKFSTLHCLSGLLDVVFLVPTWFSWWIPLNSLGLLVPLLKK